MNRQIMNEPIKVELGLWPILIAIGDALWAAGSFAVAATPYVGAAITANSLIQSFTQPKTESVSIPGVLGAKGLSSTVATALQRQRTELEALQQEGLKKQEDLAAIEAQTALKQKTEYFLSKYGTFLVAGGAVLLILLAVRKRKKR